MKRRLCIVAALLASAAVFAWNDSQGTWHTYVTRPWGLTYYGNTGDARLSKADCRALIAKLDEWQTWAPIPGDGSGRTQYDCSRITPLAACVGQYPIGERLEPLRAPWETPYIFGAWLVIVLALLWPLRRQSLSAVPEDESEPEYSESAPTRRAGFEASDTWSRPYSGQPALMFRRGRRLL